MSSRPFATLLTTATLAAATLSVGPSLWAQPPAPTPQTQARPPFRTEANFVRVDVFATLQGKPVRNLTAADFEVLEDGVPQKVATFEHVQVRTGVAQDQRQEPNTINEARDALKNPRARVFVLFLDVPHVTIEGSWQAREPLIRLLDRVLGDEDLVGIMTPSMAASDIVFGRKTQVITAGLRDRWPWGERHTYQKDLIEQQYELCYPPSVDDVVKEMTARKRERGTLEALREVVNWLRDEREERKAILTVTEGWLLYRPNPRLTELRQLAKGLTEQIPGPDPIGVGPDGRLSKVGRSSNTEVTKSECDADRVALAAIDDDRYFKDLIDDANRANASFYTIDPRGLPVFDAPIGPEPPPGVVADYQMLRTRLDSLHILANNTDGFAVLNSNNIDQGLRRIADDLTSYYLLGYYSTNAKLDGKFRKIEVKVRPRDVTVRARRGYRAATTKEVATARAAASPPDLAPRVPAVTALSALAAMRPEATVHAHAIARRGVPTAIWVAGELPRAAAAATTAVVTVGTIGASNSAQVDIASGQRSFIVPLTLKVDASGPIDVRVRVAAAGEALTDMLRIDATSGLAMPLMFRRGPSTGNRLEAAGMPQFSRTERVRFEIPSEGSMELSAARLLDRTGNAIDLPIAVSARTDADGQRWLTADLTLASLAAGDYVIELTAGSQKSLAAIRLAR
ncbi:MAG: VWA domain-containing protein [Vicinamibacterales bacterium]